MEAFSFQTRPLVIKMRLKNLNTFIEYKHVFSAKMKKQEKAKKLRYVPKENRPVAQRDGHHSKRVT